MRRLSILSESLRTVSSGENCFQLHLVSPPNHGVQLLLLYLLQSFARRHQEKHKKTLFFISILLLSFLLIQIPYIAILISEIAFLYMPQNTCFWLARAEILQLIIRLMPQVHCFSNPLVYAFTGGELRNRFTTCFQCPFFPKRLCSTQNRKQSDVSEHDQNSPSESSVDENEPP